MKIYNVYPTQSAGRLIKGHEKRIFKTSIFEHHRRRVSTTQNIKMICRRYPLHKKFFEVVLLSKLGAKMLITQRGIDLTS